MPTLSFDLLVALVRAAPGLLTYDQLMERVWAGVVVNPETVTQRVKLVRDALGDDSHEPRYIARVRSRGYRIVPPVVPITAADAATIETSGPSNAAAQVTEEGKTSGRRWRVLAGTLAGGALLAVAAAFSLQHSRERSSAEKSLNSVEVKPDRTIAVLPFANLSGDPENEYFSDGLTEELINRLASLPELHVAARTSSFHFKNKNEDVRKIASALGVRHVLEGSVRRDGGRIRVTAQLIGAENGYHLWSNSFDRANADVFQVQDEIALAVVESLRLTLVQDERAQMARRPTRNLQAYDMYLRARHLYQSMQLERIDKGIGYFEQAIVLDPSYADAYVGLVDALVLQRQISGHGATDLRALDERARNLLRKAIELTPHNADAHALLGHLHFYGRDVDDAARELHLAERLNPNGELTLRYLAQYYGHVGWPPQRAIDYARKGLRLDPLNPWAAVQVAIAYSFAQEHEAALAAVDHSLELDPQFWVSHWMRDLILMDLDRNAEAVTAAKRAIELSGGYVDVYADLVAAYARAGQREAAEELFEELQHPDRDPRWRPAARAFALAGMGRHEETLAALEQAYRENDGVLTEMLHMRIMIPLHDDPRFRDLARRLKVERRVEYTRAKNSDHVPALRASRRDGA
jgi:TolB-like protein/DNA-binding winged helix-turn-helix (wHTH) protein/thioredoxin-like negative regulator of GroEL